VDIDKIARKILDLLWFKIESIGQLSLSMDSLHLTGMFNVNNPRLF
jgi:hypothetical protein